MAIYHVRKLGLVVGIILLSLSPSLVLAATPSTPTTDKLFASCREAPVSDVCSADRSTTDSPVNHFIKVAAGIVAFLTGVVAVIMIVVSGFSYITSGGNAEKATNARRRLITALIGLAVVALAWTLISFLTDKLVKT
ncbi:hypothetical protein CO059_02115 [candidate division WWE3 bacterium CG_4_9_14_0_2_um_filter_48_10]|uniref:Uncharacterized protein n=1 Tax=candidate division WWE3 bacterium CG_4_9_14_0_2_um_filter_48_10 TaxID=1975078 RepID=A0A2M8EIY5_UNCKA|nr:MAG: hypothetical protein CO059_02115 [candidate division WWE3 bacterium CG_4_9_14_0_2_um_filter_48_10]PJE65311.1 MAG: hypothetical protein COU91_02410 [Candidatus Saccharibacteria bacterium CG10_big_fil_rev_8_21_14_0_10_47_8]